MTTFVRLSVFHNYEISIDLLVFQISIVFNLAFLLPRIAYLKVKSEAKDSLSLFLSFLSS